MAGTADLIKERLGIVEVVGSYIKLEKAGVNFKARCPFHNEKTASFFVSPTRGGFYCFGCGEKGDIFTFVEKFEGVDFLGALKILAEKAGVEIVYEKPENKSEKDTLFKILETVTEFYQNNLLKNKAALVYLKDRGLEEKTINDFRLGYAQNTWRDALQYLRKKKFKDSDIEKAGLIKKGEDSTAKDFYDRFRGRIMFPIADTSGRVVAFSGRMFDKPEKSDLEPAKYINTPETPLFSKSKVLYGYDKAKEGIRKWGFTILVEGQMDLLMSHQGGFRNTVALSGTALTDEQVALISRLSNKLVLALDGDTAGLKASGKSASLTLSRGIDVKVARLSEGKDPADLIKANPELWKKAIREATHIIDFYLEVIESMGYDKRKFQQEVVNNVFPYIARITDPIVRDRFIRTCSFKLDIPAGIIAEQIALIPKENERVDDDARNPLEKISPDSRIDSFLRRLLGLVEAERSLKKHKIVVKEVEARLKEIVGTEEFAERFKHVRLSPDIVFEGEILYESEEQIAREVEDLLLNLKYHTLKASFESFMHELRDKEKSGESKEAEALLAKCHELSREIAKIDLLLKK